jgi:hypothetical protein
MCGQDATKINSEEAYVHGEKTLRASDDFKQQVASGKPDPVVEKPLEEVFGPNYKEHVSGQSRQTPWDKANPDTTTPTTPTDFTDGTVKAIYRKNASGGYDLVTMFPNPK